MTISVACGSCAKRFRANEKLAGKRVKCPECGGVLTIPPVDSAALPRLCPSCAQPLDSKAILCVSCGYDTRVGRKIITVTDADEAEDSSHNNHFGKKLPKSVLAAASSTGHFARGCVFSLIGALIGAGIWYGVALGLKLELGWIACVLGFLAGAGMAIGHREGDDGAGIAAAAISLAGIFAAKWMIYANCMAPIISAGVMESLYGEGETVPGFFSLMFGPMDGIFVLLAFFTAYKVGSGKPTSGD